MLTSQGCDGFAEVNAGASNFYPKQLKALLGKKNK